MVFKEYRNYSKWNYIFIISGHICSLTFFVYLTVHPICGILSFVFSGICMIISYK